MVRNSCSLVTWLEESVGGGTRPQGKMINSDIVRNDISPPIPAIRVLRVVKSNGFYEEWIRMSGPRDVVETFKRTVKRNSLAVSKVFGNKYGVVLRIRRKPGIFCEKCPMVTMPPGVMPKSVILLPGAMLLELIVADERAMDGLRRMRCEMIHEGNLGSMDYMLTPSQEAALMLAFFRGYYRFPRKTSLKKLAEEAGMAVSSLTELLRKAEGKVVEAFVRHEMPHYMALRILRNLKGRRRVETILLT